MRRKIVCWLITAAMIISVMPVSFAENTQTDEMLDIQEEILSTENTNTEETSETTEERADTELFSDEIQLFAAYTPRTSSPNGVSYYYSNSNPFYSSGYVGECTWYAWGRAYEILGSRPSLPTNSGGLWYGSCNAYPKSTNYYAAKVGAIACYSNHVAVVEAVGSNGAPSAISEGGFQSSHITGQIVEPINNRSDRYFHYGKDYTKGFQGYIYILNNADGGTGAGGSVHTHSWSYANEFAHPHREYRTCSCGAKEYTGKTKLSGSCSSCYPVGNASLKRSFDRIAKTATFYRNNVSNVNNYTLTLYKDGSYYDDYNMYSTTQSVSRLPSGTYYATLMAKNTNTGQSRTVSCSSFTIVDSYKVTYNANGGTNAPSQQLKVQNEPLTLTSSKPQRAHYVFKGWAASKTATSPQYESGDTYTKNTAITLYAVWEPEIYTINFDVNSGRGEVPSTTITYGDSMKMPNSIVRDGYYLKGWSKNKLATAPDYKIGLDYKLDANMTLYAVWGQSAWDGDVASEFAGGDGTKENPYQISNAAELAHLADKVNTQTSAPEYEYYKLTDNINIAATQTHSWVSIGSYYNENQYFCGSFDGNGYTISDLSISDKNENYVGLFGCAKNSEIKNLGISGNINSISFSNAAYIGMLCSYADTTDITGCRAMYVNISDITNLSASDYSYMGTLCGYISGNISDCESNEGYIGMKDGLSYTGMLSGYTRGSVVNSNVKATDGLFESTADTDNLYLGGITGKLEGSAEKCTVSAGAFSNTLQTNIAYIGGIAGYLDGEIRLCTAQFGGDMTKTIDGASYPSTIYNESSSAAGVGGITGYIAKRGRVTNCKYDGQSVSSSSTGGVSDVGGIAGQIYGNALTKVNVSGGQIMSHSSLPKRTGYTATWYTDSALTKEYDFSQPVTADMTLYAKWAEGETNTPIWDGTSSEPAYNGDTKTYIVTNGKELAWISDVTNGVITSGTNFPEKTTFEGYTVELANDIYLNDISNVANWETTPPENIWKPIGKDANYYFKGIIDGKGYAINGIYFGNNYVEYAGLFGYLKGEVKNLDVINGYIYAKTYVGGIAGFIAYHSDVLNCYNSLTVKGYKSESNDVAYTGGIVGFSDSYSTISYCGNEGAIKNASGFTNSGKNVSGGIIGCTYSTDIKRCYNIGTVSSTNISGGIVGEFGRYSTISECYNSGKVNATNIISVCAGGIAGTTKMSSIISLCHNYGDLSTWGGHNYLNVNDWGGIIGRIDESTTLSESYNHKELEEKTYANVGGLVGIINESATIKYCYANQSTLYNASDSSLTSIKSVSYKSSSAMKSLSNLTGFSSNDWATNSSINSGYPYLKSLEDTYKTYTVTAIEDPENSAVLNKCFANMNSGILFSNSKTSRASVGGIAGYAGLSSSVSTAPANNLLAVGDKVSAVTSASSPKAQSGYIIGGMDYNALEFNKAYYKGGMELSAVNLTRSEWAFTNTTGSSRPPAQIKYVSFLNQVFGPDTYQSLEHLKENPDAVWVVKEGEYPDLYYNVLNDITISESENGTVSVDKTQAVDGERVTVTAKPDENYQLNKIYVNGAEIVGNVFEVTGDSDIYATFTEKTPEYKVTVQAAENAGASVVNVDEVNLNGISLFAVDDSLTAKDGEEIRVDTTTSEDYTVDAVYVNGEPLESESFIITVDSVVTMDVTSISTDIKAVTNDATDIGNYFATLSGSVEDIDGAERYIRYWAADNPDEVFTTEVQQGGGDYSVEVTNLIPETTYYYQMTETGEIKSFDAKGYDMSEIDNPVDPDDPANPTPTPSTVPVETDEPAEQKEICFEIKKRANRRRESDGGSCQYIRYRTVGYADFRCIY